MATRETENDPEEQTDIRHAVRRRGLIAGVAAVVASAALLRKSEAVAAIDTNTAVVYKAVSPYSDSLLFWADASQLPDVNGAGQPYNVLGLRGDGKGAQSGILGVGGNTHGYGTYGIGGSSNGTGVRGDGQGGGAGVIGAGGDSDGTGVAGYGTGHGTGVQGSGGTNNATGVAGYGTGHGTGVVGGAGSIDGTGVAGYGTSGIGVYGEATTGASKGVYGKHFGGGAGVYGESVNGRAIYGITPNGFGVEGISTSFYGVVGRSTTSIGVFGSITGGSAPGTIAIDGSNLSTGADSHGIVGVATVGHGLVGTTNFSGGGPPYYAGLVGNAPNGAYAGLFFGNVQINGTLNGHAAVVQHANLAVAHPDGTHRLANSIGAVESWLEDFGEGTLANGQATITIDPAFAVLADMGKYHVFLTSHGDYNLHVAEMKGDGFVVRVTSASGSTPPTGGGVVPGSQVAKAGSGTGTFSWRVTAKRKDGQAARLATYAFPKTEAPKNPSPLTHPPTAAAGEVVAPTIPPLPPAPPKPAALPKSP